ncbi:hypothetical protein PVL29_015728 [Vitis rotundifolia]|uniref:Uncharacterized protein n=1 Tax=Vitis rotundifolia TaxID=103349 RepID=A0AA38ZDF3_VITRO|nr:hypothetical protein PVL29_015728 [Vitis rotundifolia]
MARPVQKERTLLLTSPSSSSASSSSSSSPFSSSSDELEVRVGRLMPPVICDEEEEENGMASNLRVKFRERQRKLLFESITVSPSHSKKACPKPTPNPLS